MWSIGVACGLAMMSGTWAAAAAPATRPGHVLSGADVSMLPEIEKAGGVFRDKAENGDKGQAEDEIRILRKYGCDLFRVRLFVDPGSDVHKNFGATQDLEMVKGLAKRIKAAGGTFLLDIHYSDSWADPAHQIKPKAWDSLPLEELEKQVQSYTTDVIRQLQAIGAGPEMVQVGNEITSGMLWPEGRLSHGPKEKEPQQWANFVSLLGAGIRGVRAAQRPGEKIDVVLHIHGGGREGLPQWFFKELMAHGGTSLDFDIIGLSFYPAWKDSLGVMKKNMDDLIASYGKPVLLAEVGYPWAPVDQIEGKESMEWPMTREGQKDYLEATKAAMVGARDGKGLGFVWWYSDAIPVKDKSLAIWRKGNEGLFDHEGQPLPSMSLLGNGESGK